MDLAALCIQKHTRGMSARRRVSTMKEPEWTQDWGIAQNAAASTLGRYIKGYLARKQVEKIRKDNDEEAEARRQVESVQGSEAQVLTEGSAGSLGGDLDAECFRAQIAALAQ
ncbi:hypothetical protein CYMTET_45739, partial [Cymbomonas tetramitiformis]